ncbi:MAG: RNA polymerase sigma factor (sigma-70 family) [Akkermansiaceae bacterium]|jgi:RNA polymerase sigma factor (sigma-70 family)
MMNLGENKNLWQEFRSGRSERIFAEIVKHYSGMVYATALRGSDGAHGLAEEIMQEVFCNLVKKTGRLPQDLCLGGWLYRHACHLTANRRRSETRRRKRELIAAEMMNNPVSELPPEIVEELDKALCSLPKTSREMLVMRYFEAADYRMIAKQFGLTDEAARKRIARSLEKLRNLFAKRGLGVSSVTLAAGLSAFSTGKVSAAKQVEMVGCAMKIPVSEAGVLLNLSAFIAGALAVSAVAVGVQKVAGSSGPVSSIPRTEFSDRSINAGRGGLRDEQLSQEDLIARIQRLSDGPQQALTRLELRALLTQVPDEEIPAFSELSIVGLSPDACKFCNRYLFGRWFNNDPAVALLAAMRGDFSDRSGLGSFMYRGGAHSWANRDPRAMREWLLKNWTEIEAFGYSDSTGLMAPSLGDSAVSSLMWKEGIGKALESLDTFPSEIQAGLLESLVLARTSNQALNTPVIYRYLKDHPDEKSLWTKFLRSWAEEDPATMLATLDQEPSEERYRNKLLLFGGIHPSGPEVEQADGTITMSTADGVVYASLAERERQVAEAGINAGYSMVEIRQAIDASHKVISSRHSFFEWTDDILEAAELEILRTKLTDFEKSQTPKNSRMDYAAVYHSAIWNSATLPDQPFRQEVCESLFGSFLRLAPDLARDFSKMAPLPNELKEKFQTLAK